MERKRFEVIEFLERMVNQAKMPKKIMYDKTMYFFEGYEIGYIDSERNGLQVLAGTCDLLEIIEVVEW